MSQITSESSGDISGCNPPPPMLGFKIIRRTGLAMELVQL
jgi:hypothetical protein